MRTVRERGQGDFLFVPALVSLLRHRGLKAPARDVLVGYGEEVVPALAHFLRDPEEDIWVRRHVPSTLSRIPCQASMDVLVAALVDEKDAFLRYKCVAAIDRLHDEHPELTFDPKPIETLAWLEGMQFYQFLSYHDNLFTRGGITTPCLLKSLLEEKRARARDRVFFMLALLYPRRDVMAARWELEHGDARAKASACEYLDNVLSGPLRRRLMPMLEDLTDEERVSQGQRDPADAPARRRGDAADPDQQRRRGGVGGGDRPGRPPRAALAGRRPRSRAGPPRRARLARLRGGVVDAGRPAPAGVEAARAVARAAAQRRDRQPAAGDSRSSPRSRPTSCSGSRAPAGRSGSIAATRSTKPARCRRTSTSCSTARCGPPRPTARRATCSTRRRSASRKCSKSAPHPETVRAVETSVALQLTVEEARGLLADNTDLVQGLFRWMLDHPAFGTGRLVVRGTGAASGDGRPARRSGRARPTPRRPRRCGRSTSSWRCGAFPLFARSSVEARLALAAIAREERLEPNGVLLHASDAPAIRLVDRRRARSAGRRRARP